MQTISYELAKKLKYANFVCDSFFYWTLPEIGKSLEIILVLREENSPLYPCDYPAYTLDEILEYLPARFQLENKTHSLFLKKYFYEATNETKYVAGYRFFFDNSGEELAAPLMEATNPAEAAGELLLWCIENGYVKINKGG